MMNRRNFINTSALAGSSVLASGVLTSCGGAEQGKPKIKRTKAEGSLVLFWHRLW